MEHIDYYPITMTSAGLSQQALLHTFCKNIRYVRKTSSGKDIDFPSYICSIYTNRSEYCYKV